MIVGKRIILRAWERSDIETFQRWFNDVEITIYAGDAYPALSSGQEERYYQNHADDKHTYCIVTRDQGVLIGNCALFNIVSRNRSAEVGITIGEKAYWNQGYGRETLGMLLEIAFEGLGLNRVSLRVVDFNERARRCYLTAGFVEEGHLRQDTFIKGKFHDVIIMAILADEYSAHKRARPNQ